MTRDQIQSARAIAKERTRLAEIILGRGTFDVAQFEADALFDELRKCEKFAVCDPLPSPSTAAVLNRSHLNWA